MVQRDSNVTKYLVIMTCFMTLTPFSSTYAKACLLAAGPIAAIAIFFLIPAGNLEQPSNFAARFSLAVSAWIALWWITEVIPLATTALIPLVVFSFFQIRPFSDLIQAYFHPIIFLFLGGFVISIALQKWRLDRRFAVFVVGLFGTERNALVGGMMLATALLSMWISNTATTIMMLPIALSLIATNQFSESFGRCVLLAIAYSASIGGIATIIGTPPNTFVASYLRESMQRDVGFLEWMQLGLPLAGVFLILAWGYLVFVRYPKKAENVVSVPPLNVEAKPGKLHFPEWATLIVFASVALGWLSRRWLNGLEILNNYPLANLTDAHIAISGAIMLLILPARTAGHSRLLMLGELAKVPWGTLVLFGGGLALASTIRITGADQLIGAWLAGLPKLAPIIVLGVVVMFVVFLTELTSNIATTATMVPILAASAHIFGLDATTVIVASAFSASCAFMLPVATPPNAIIYGSGKVSSREMAKAGFVLNVIGIFLITLVMHVWFDGFG